MNIKFKPEQMLPDLLREHPQLRPVFDKYGLKGCGGIEGPSESLEFFAKTHGVEPDQLYKELTSALADTPPELVKEHWADSIYRPFFGAGIVIALLAGAAFGTYMMFQMGVEKSVFAPGIHAMNAHAHVMVYGFIGMFVFGFGYQALPRFKHTNLKHPNLAAMSGVLLLAGLAMRFFGEFFGQTTNMSIIGTDSLGFYAAMIGTGLELLAFSMFAGILASTYRASGKKLETYDYYIIASIFWFAASLIYSGAHFWALAASDGAAQLIERVGVLQDPLRNMQLYGAISFLIFGVFFRFLPPVFGFRNPGDKLYRWMLVVINIGLALLVGGSLLMSATKKGWVYSLDEQKAMLSTWRGVYSIGGLMLAGGLFTMMIGFRPWRKVSVDDRSIKFFRAAFVWMTITLLMLLMLPVYFAIVDKGFLHGYLWGMRHAMTLGFIVMSIMAVSIKIVPTLNGIDTGKLSKLTGIFVALNVAAFVRVSV
ncbi:MAG: NnrS family protein, partial [Planctomycetota bacterium]